MKSSILSGQYNLSLGFIPAILSMVLSEWTGTNLAVYLGASFGLGVILLEKWREQAPLSWILLYSTTGVLLLLSLFSWLFGECCEPHLLPLTLEISILFPPILLIINRGKWLQRHPNTSRKRQLRQMAGLESALVSAKIMVILGAIHFSLVSICVLTIHPLSDTLFWILYQGLPPILFIVGMLLNQMGIRYFNQLHKKIIYLPIVNEKGDVIGKVSAWHARNKRDSYLLPVVRIAITTQGMLFLHKRPTNNGVEPGKSDLPIEGYLLYGESLEQGITRMVKAMLPALSQQHVHFNLKYHYQQADTNRLIYLFSIDLPDDTLLRNAPLSQGKLWTLGQIEDNLKHHFFSSYFEYEYESLKEVICTREKYKES